MNQSETKTIEERLEALDKQILDLRVLVDDVTAWNKQLVAQRDDYRRRAEDPRSVWSAYIDSANASVVQLQEAERRAQAWELTAGWGFSQMKDPKWPELLKAIYRQSMNSIIAQLHADNREWTKRQKREPEV